MSKTTKALAILGVVAGLGVAALPISAMAEAKESSHDVTVNLTIEDVLSFTIDTEDKDKTVTLSGTGTTGLFTAAAIDLYVETTAKGGYTLTMVGSTDGSDETALVNDSQTAIAGDGFSDLDGEESAWGYQTSTTNSFTTNTYNKIPGTSSSATINSSDGAAADHAYVKFGAYIAPGQESGTYSGKVTFTAAPEAD